MKENNRYIYTDLACEDYERTDTVNASGVSYNEYDADGMKIADLQGMTSRDGEKALGKPIGFLHHHRHGPAVGTGVMTHPYKPLS